MDALGPTPFKIEKEINSFLRDLRKTSPDLSKEEILAKIKIWINSHSGKNPEQEAKIVKQFYLKLHPDKLLKEVDNKNILYLKKAAKEELAFYFKALMSAYKSKVKKKEKLPNRMEYISPDGLILLYNKLYSLHQNEKQHGVKYSSAQIFKEIQILIDFNCIEEQKKPFAKRIADHLALIHESVDIQKDFNIVDFEIQPLSMSASIAPDEELSDLERRSLAFFFFKEKVSKKDYKIYFKNLEKEIVLPKGFFANIRFYYVNTFNFAVRVVRYGFWNILKGTLITALVVPLAFVAFFLVATSIQLGFLAALAQLLALKANFAVLLPVFSALTFILSPPLVAASLYTGDFLKGYLFFVQLIVLAPVVAISGFFSLLFNKTPVVKPAPAQPNEWEEESVEPKAPSKLAPKSKKSAAKKSEPDSGSDLEEPVNKKSSGPKLKKGASPEADELD